MPSMKSRLLQAAGLFAGALVLMPFPGAAQEPTFPPDEIAKGASIFSRNCSPCHGTRMRDPESAFDLRKFPHDQHERFVSSVTRGKNMMPPWGDLLAQADIEALWSYVVAGEKN
jgi:mono/diheme cytochrome c family protein